MNMNINLTANEGIPKYSAIPPHTPTIALSVDDFLSLFFKAVNPLIKVITLLCFYVYPN